jgi:hypothetical protein
MPPNYYPFSVCLIMGSTHRVFPYTANSYDEWNQPKAERGSSAGAAVPPMGGHSFFPLVHSPKVSYVIRWTRNK